MKNFNRRNTLMLTLLLVTIPCFLNAQVIPGISAFEKIIEFEGQRFLMNEIYNIDSLKFDRLRIDRTIKEVDSDEGFIFALTSYTFNGIKGVVLTSFNSARLKDAQSQFVNILLSDKEYKKLYKAFIELENNIPNVDEHFLYQFNSRIIVDVYNEMEVNYYSLWIDNYSKHTLTTTKWERGYQRYLEFTSH